MNGLELIGMFGKIQDDVMTENRFAQYWEEIQLVTDGFPAKRDSFARIWCFFIVNMDKLLN